MSIFDIFTGGSTDEAARKNAELYAQYGQQATSALQGAERKSVGALDTGFTGTTGALNTARGDISAGTAGGVDAYNRALAEYAALGNLGSKYGGATSLYFDALGANGPEGTARAQSAFTASPGYQFQVNEATDKAQRAINRFQPGGNEADAIARLTSGLAGTEYGNWLQRLGVAMPYELQATQGAAAGRAGTLGQIGQTYVNQGGQLAGVEGARAGAYATDAANRLGLYRGTAGDIANVAANVASGTANSNTAAANAQMQGSGQFWNAALGALGGWAGAKYPVRPA